MVTLVETWPIAVGNQIAPADMATARKITDVAEPLFTEPSLQKALAIAKIEFTVLCNGKQHISVNLSFHTSQDLQHSQRR